ncbi:hypothetical protein, partial [Okeania sp. SIO2G5]|uniref:hypothetical protein n=1 Tax=Okeania sp. SIO2G5 TaxID=2607796 RepID=UPI0013C0E1C0
MPEQTVKIDIPFQTLVDALSALGHEEKQKIWEFLDAELFPDDKYSSEELSDIEAAHAAYKSGDYVTVDQLI